MIPITDALTPIVVFARPLLATMVLALMVRLIKNR